MSTRVVADVYSYSITYVTDQMLSSLKRIIIWIGLDPTNFVHSWPSTELAVSTWLRSRHLQTVELEIYNPRTNSYVGGWEFSIDYSYGSGDDGSMWVDTDAIRNAIIKCGVIPAACQYRILLQTSPGEPAVPGWGATTVRSKDGFVRQSVGTTIGTFAVGAQASYWRKK
jgi:hypothetical protein